MSEEANSEQSNEEVSGNDTGLESTGNNEETQQTSTSEQVDTSVSGQESISEVGLQRSEEPDVESDESSAEVLDGLVNAALAGKLTDEQRASLDEGGFGKHFDMIVEGQRAQIAANDAEIISVVGTKEAYSELQEWALSNLDDSEIASFNMAVLESGDIGLAKLAVEGLQARYQKVNGSAPSKRIEAGETANDATRPYSSRDEYINEAMSHKYKQDPVYREQVEAKRNLSGF